MATEANTETKETAAEETPYPLQLCRYMTERSPLPMIAAEGLTHIVRYVNPAFCRLVGKTSGEVIGRPFALAVPEGEENGCVSLLERVYRTGEAENLADQVHSPGTLPPVYWSYAVWAVLDAQERPAGVMIQITDTTESAQNRLVLAAISQALMLTGVHLHELLELSEGTTRSLQQAMRETDHRVKNNLQAISSLLDIQIMSEEETVPVRDLIQIRTYIKTMSVIHDMLVQNVKYDPTGTTMSVRVALQKLMPMLQLVVGENRVEWYAEEVRLPIKQGISLAVLINELVNNAVKHGGRTVEVRLVTSESIVMLEVFDDGPGFSEAFDPKRAANYGLELVESVCRLDLRGVTTYENRSEGGACVRITFPLSHQAVASTAGINVARESLPQ